jgi:ribonuclease BN (tRNA processing enzyme)
MLQKNISKSNVIKKSKLKSVHDIYIENQITHLGYTGIPSVAARQTVLERGAILFDAGFVPREIGMKKRLVLISHFHSDHGSDVCNCIGGDHRITVFVPAYCTLHLFRKIQADISMQKGRIYTDEEICKMVRIIGCKRENGEFGDQNSVIVSTNPDISIEFIKMGDQIDVSLSDRDSVMIEPFSCYHTVDTCGYVVHDIRKKLSDRIMLNVGTTIEANFTEDQNDLRNKKIMHKQKKKHVINENVNDAIVNVNDGNVDDNMTDDNVNDQMMAKFIDVKEFSERHGIVINTCIIEKPITPKFTLRSRCVQFPEGMCLKTKDENGNCVLTSSDFSLLSKYKINVTQNILTPVTMFFGDTCSYVFNPIHTRVCEYLNIVKNVIIECTYLENQHQLDPIKFKKRKDKKHIFLFELVPVFKANPMTQFLLIHFSARYTKDIIQKYINDVISQHNCNNIRAFI